MDEFSRGRGDWHNPPVPSTSTSAGPATDKRAVFASTGPGYYATIVSLFCALLLLSNIGATKAITFGDFILDGGVFVFPLTYVLGDVLTEVYGFRAARKAIGLGFVFTVIAAITFWLVSISPGLPGAEDHFAALLGPIPQILLASVSGYVIGEFLNSYVLVKIKQRTAEKHLWVRLVTSTLVGEFFDTLVFCVIAGPAIGITGFADLMNYTLVGFVVKVAVEVVMLPVTYAVIGYVKKREPTYQAALRAQA